MRRGPLVLLALVVVVAMITALWRYVAVGDTSTELRLTEVVGEVTVRGARGELGATEGAVLETSDRVATGERARATLTLGRDTRIRLGPTSSVQVTGIDESGVSLELEDGALQATVRPESGAVTVGNAGRSVVATNGSFEAGVRDEVFQVRAVDGPLALSGVDVTRLDPGSEAVLVARKAEVQPAPEEMLLSVRWPESEGRTRDEITTVQGTTVPGARVWVRGSFGEREVRAGTDGVFTAEVPLAEGENEVEIEAVDPLGHRAEVSGSLAIRDTRGPSFQGGVEYGD